MITVVRSNNFQSFLLGPRVPVSTSLEVGDVFNEMKPVVAHGGWPVLTQDMLIPVELSANRPLTTPGEYYEGGRT